MKDPEQFDRQVRQIQRSLEQQKLRLQICIREVGNIQRKLIAITGCSDMQNITIEPVTLKQIAVANGRLLPPEQMNKLSTDDYDVVLDCIAQQLLARVDPDNHTKLKRM
jgi:hypothetical protein